MKTRNYILATGIFSFLSCRHEQPQKLNVLFIIVDDLNAWINAIDPANPIKTPNMERLAKRGMIFTHAYCSSPASNPSRTSLLTGYRPDKTGVYDNDDNWKQLMPGTITLPRYFKLNGYYVAGAGKVFHHHAPIYHDSTAFDDYRMMPAMPPDQPMPAKKLSGMDEYSSCNFDWGIWPEDEKKAVDVITADFIISKLKEKHDKPVFIAAGIFRPHMPFFAPERFFDRYPEDNVVMPLTKENDLDDVPSGGKNLVSSKPWFKYIMGAEKKRPGTWRSAVRAYQAAASFADEQIGKILDALDSSSYSGNTIIVLLSDNGYHLGDKDQWEKFDLWEQDTHVPLIIVSPGLTKPGTVCTKPVELIHIYKTLIDLCGLPDKNDIDGHSMKPLLINPDTTWDHPAIMTYLNGNHAIRTKDWRYIRYADASEELYNEINDPNEWKNLAGDHNRIIMDSLAEWIPGKNEINK